MRLSLSHCATTGRSGLTVPGSASRTSSNLAAVTAKSQSARGAAWPLARDPASATAEIPGSAARTPITAAGKITGLAESCTKRSFPFAAQSAHAALRTKSLLGKDRLIAVQRILR